MQTAYFVSNIEIIPNSFFVDLNVRYVVLIGEKSPFDAVFLNFRYVRNTSSGTLFILTSNIWKRFCVFFLWGLQSVVILEGKKSINGSGIVAGYPQFLIIADLVAASIDSVQSLDICTIYSENTAAVPRPYIVTAVIQWPVYNA